MGGLVDVMDDLSKVSLEVSRGKFFKVGQSSGRNITLPLEVALARVDQPPQLGVLAHEVNEGPGELQLVTGDRCLATGQSQGSLLLVCHCGSGHLGHLPHVGGEHDEVVVLVDVVHDLHLEESLGGIVHDLVGQLGLGNVLPQLLDTSASSLGSSILVNHLVTFVLGGNSVLQGGNKLLDDLKLSTEERVLAGVHGVPVHLEEVKVDTRNCLNKSLKGGVDLELFEQAGDDTGSGCPGEPNLVVDDDGGVDAGSNKVFADCVKVGNAGGSGVANWNSEVDKTWEGLLQSLDHILQGLQILNLYFVLLLADVNILQLVGVLLHATFNHPHELGFVSIESRSGDSSKLGILADLVWRPGADGSSIDVHIWLLPHVQPDDLPILGVDGTAHLLEAVLETLCSGLATAVDLVAGDPTEF